jgi:hypothetical protein
VCLHHDRAARGQRGGGVAARHREREREVGRREHGHRPYRAVDPPQVRDDAFGVGDHGVLVTAAAKYAREHPQLGGGAGHLTDEPLAAQCGLGVGDRGQLAGPVIQRVGHRLQRRGPLGQRGPGAPRGRGGQRRGHDRVDLGVGGLGDRLPHRLCGARVKPLNHRLSSSVNDLRLLRVGLRVAAAPG